DRPGDRRWGWSRSARSSAATRRAALRSASTCPRRLPRPACRAPPRRRIRPRRYNLSVPRRPLSDDTSLEVEQLQIERLRGLTSEERLAIVSGLNRTVIELARAGIRRRHPQASLREQFLRLAIITLGPDLAREVYSDVADLDRKT